MGGTITALVVQKKNKERVNVYLDGVFAFGLAMVEALHLRRGQVLNEDDIAQLKARDDVEKARQQTLGLLERRPRSVEEVRRYLAGKGYPSETVDEAVERLSQAGLLDDHAFARFWLENRDEFRPRGQRALRQELRHKGISNDTINDVLDEGHDEDEAAYRAILPKAHRWSVLGEQEFRKKTQSFLVRRGFSYETARTATERIWQEINAVDGFELKDQKK